jgi:NAD(P)H-hydrate epimerase
MGSESRQYAASIIVGMIDPGTHAYSPDVVREFDRIAIEERGIPGSELMRRAGVAVFDAARRAHPRAARWLILCGAGNNAGDGYVIARLARAAGLQVTVVAVADPVALRGDAARAHQEFAAAGGQTSAFDPALASGADLIIDALFGTGLARPVDGLWRSAIEAVNAAHAPVVAVDLPSGLCARTGRALGVAVRAELTVTFIAWKQGLFLEAGPEHAGRLELARLEVPADVLATARPTFRIFDAAAAASLLPRRERSGHKGRYGHVLVVGGNHGMAGAARLAGEAALRTGAGLVSVATRVEHAVALAAARPELMCHGIEAGPSLDRSLSGLLERATVVAVGPGLGQDDWARTLYRAALAGGRPTVLDADALNLLAADPAAVGQCVLTPHPGEAGRLLGSTAAAVQADRLGALAALLERYRAVVVLKGQGTLVGAPGEVPCIITAGNPGMASGGMGDVLTGVVAGLLAQLPAADRLDVAACAAWAHAVAGDAAARAGERGLVASDVIAGLRACLNPSN